MKERKIKKNQDKDINVRYIFFLGKLISNISFSDAEFLRRVIQYLYST